MADLPIAFSAPMVLALIAGRKTQTRRVLRAKAGMTIADATVDAGPALGGIGRRLELPVDKLQVPYSVGDRLYVREGIARWISGGNPAMAYVKYRADHKETFQPWPEKWKIKFAPPMHMPREFSRLTLVVTDVRVQRLQDISIDDAKAEGVPEFAGDACRLGLVADEPHAWHEWDNRSSIENYRSLWDHLNADRAPWVSNPWVAAYTFNVIKAARS